MPCDLLSDNGFDFKSSYKTIFALKNNLFYFEAISQYGLYMLDL